MNPCVFLHRILENDVRERFDSQRSNTDTYTFEDYSSKNTIENDFYASILADDLKPNNMENSLPIQKFDIFLDYFKINILNRIISPDNDTFYSSSETEIFGSNDEAPYSDTDNNEAKVDTKKMALKHAVICGHLIAGNYKELVPDLIEGVKRIQDLLIRNFKAHDSTMKILDRVSVEFFLQVFRNPGCFVQLIHL